MGKSDMSVGGIQAPKHLGQSGQPIPEPVIRTKPPAHITKKTTKIVVLHRLLYSCR